MSVLTLSGLFVYPVKSAAGISVGSAVLTPRGLQGDRRWMVVDSAGRFLTQRRFPTMSLIHVSLSAYDGVDSELVVRAPGMSELSINAADESDGEIEVEVWGDRTTALSAGAAAQAWFSQYLSTPCQLVFMPESSKRPTEHGKFGPDEIVSFADAYPYLLLTQASLDGLNQKLAAKQAAPVPMNRFRPNLVISGEVAAHAEDEWKRIRIGGALFKVAKPCARCSIPNVNQASGDRTQEPSKTLATYRAWDREIWFGQNLIRETAPKSSESKEVTLRVGDRVEVLK